MSPISGDLFSLATLTAAINELPYTPGRAGAVIPWEESGITTTKVLIEEKAGQLSLLDPTPRGGPGHAFGKTRRKMRELAVPHYQIDDAIWADEVQGVRAFGSESQLQTIQGKINERLQEHVNLRLDPTLEFQRIGAVKGQILNADGSMLYDLFSQFGVSPPAVAYFDLSNANPPSGAIRSKCASVVRYILNTLGTVPSTVKVHAFAGDGFFDKLVAAKETRETFLNQQQAASLRESVVYQTFHYGGITFENYRGAVEGTPFIADDDVQIFPIGVPQLWKTVFAPAEYNETVNTQGLPRYVYSYPMQNNKGTLLEVSSNSLSFCTRPTVLIRGNAAASGS